MYPKPSEMLHSLSLRQRIAQLLHVAAWSDKDEEHYEYIESLVQEFGIGGLIFFQGTPERQVELTNRYQQAAAIPLMISIDAEWGLAMRLENTMAFPYAITLGAIPEEQLGLIEEMGYEIGLQCRRLGVHVNFAPVADVNTEPANPVIAFRAFGRDKQQVLMRAEAYAQGLTRARVLPVAKHFPGHGDTTVDSHLALPRIVHDRERLDQVELYPFKQLIARGIGAIMTGHIEVPAIDPRPNRPASLSRAISYELLQKTLGFEGLVFTDALNMKGASEQFQSGQLEVEALKAGNDILLYCEDVPAAIDAIEQAIDQGEISEDWLNARVTKQLAMKDWLHISDKLPETQGLHEGLHTPRALQLNRELHRASLRVLYAYPHDLRIEGSVAALAFQVEPPLPFHEYVPGLDCMYWTAEQDAHWQNYLRTLGDYDMVIVSVHTKSMKAKENFGLEALVRSRVREALTKLPAVLVLFAHPQSLNDLTGGQPIPTVLAWQPGEDAQAVAAALFR